MLRNSTLPNFPPFPILVNQRRRSQTETGWGQEAVSNANERARRSGVLHKPIDWKTEGTEYI